MGDIAVDVPVERKQAGRPIDGTDGGDGTDSQPPVQPHGRGGGDDGRRRGKAQRAGEAVDAVGPPAGVGCRRGADERVVCRVVAGDADAGDDARPEQPGVTLCGRGQDGPQRAEDERDG